jgi:uncharacterized protein
MYDSSVPVFVHFLKSLAAILKKAEAHCAARKIDPDVMVAQRLFPDMLALARQVQIASDSAKGGGARLAGVAVPSYADDEKTFADLQARIAKTIGFLESLKKEQFDGAATRTVTIKVGDKDQEFTGLSFLETRAKPNFFFHLTTAYNILRHNGVEIGKRDYLSGGKA